MSSKPRRRRGVRDPRIWVGLAITVVTLWLALRDVSFAAMARDMAQANFPLLLGVSVPANLLALYLRSLRWRHLTDPVQRIATPPLFRATAVGLMVNNLFPLRVGEVVRAWYLSRETGAPAAALFGTVLLERLVDALSLLALAAVVMAPGDFGGGGGPAALLVSLLLLAGLPIVFVIALRVAPGSAVHLFELLARPVLPERVRVWAEGQIRRLAEGLGALRRGRHLFWIVWHSAWLWGCASIAPFFAAIVALGIELPTLWEKLKAAYVMLVFVGAAVALPSAPGFFGPYHAACRLALSAFGVPAGTAVALGTLCHAISWVTVTAVGILVLRFGGVSLEATLQAGAAEPPSAPEPR